MAGPSSRGEEGQPLLACSHLTQTELAPQVYEDKALADQAFYKMEMAQFAKDENDSDAGEPRAAK